MSTKLFVVDLFLLESNSCRMTDEPVSNFFWILKMAEQIEVNY